MLPTRHANRGRTIPRLRGERPGHLRSVRGPRSRGAAGFFAALGRLDDDPILLCDGGTGCTCDGPAPSPPRASALVAA